MMSLPVLFDKSVPVQLRSRLFVKGQENYEEEDHVVPGGCASGVSTATTGAGKPLWARSPAMQVRGPLRPSLYPRRKSTDHNREGTRHRTMAGSQAPLSSRTRNRPPAECSAGT